MTLTVDTVQTSDNPVTAEVERKAAAAQAAGRILARAGTTKKNAALEAIAVGLSVNTAAILDANAADVKSARSAGSAEYYIDRLTLTEKRIDAMSEGVRQVASLPDPIGEVLGGWVRPNGIELTKVRVPLGVIGIIYESRPNVTIDAAALCIKSGNATVLRGGSETIESNKVLARILQDALESAGLPRSCVELIETTDRAAARHLMTLKKYLDCLIPRGGAGLIRSVVDNATVPVIETGTGNCHVYIDKHADFEMAENITINAKCQRVSVCNSAETLLVHSAIAADFLPRIGNALIKNGVEIRGDSAVCKAIHQAKEASEDDWYEEYNALIIAVKVVDSVQDAIDHINKYGSRHTETIVTSDYFAAQEFTEGVDSAAAFVNISTRFTDGFEFGFGAEIGISNQKLHARGPMGLTELTTYKYVGRGNGQIRG
jgi:glutamate-5-semialdehyde dehydrogenase